MITEENETEWIDRFLSGTLDEASIRMVKQRMEEEEGFREKVALQQSLNEQIRLHNRLEMKKRLAAISDEGNYRWIWWAAASVLILIAAYGAGKYLLDNQPKQPLAATTYIVPVQEIDSTALGFGKNAVILDSLVMQVIIAPASTASYTFSDTLILYLPQPSGSPTQWTVYYRPADQRYFLKADTVVYQLEKGFNRPRELIKASF
ncbi:hypothetical protein [Parachryseolinea silvisoli]|uniref:hypothetical protein n=1 Tax=Parachryseolinea silvisoli TaxID=2873601 RepID=UPI002265CD1F|nr:hypothetical protein [Parachryseolinea silvisoli]MCD9015346.1 hypothetical protein [Parachryseolinea silvisoli]